MRESRISLRSSGLRVCRCFSKLLAIDNKALMLGELVVERARGGVGLMRLPIDARRAQEFGLLIDALDQRASDALATRGFRREQILQIAQRLDQCRAAVKQVMRQPQQFAATFGNEAIDRL